MTSRTKPDSLLARGRREQRKHLTRRELLAAGRRLFADKGLYESRIEDLSRHAGIAKGTLYGYFRNKSELIEAVVSNGFSELLGRVHRDVQGASSRDEAVTRTAAAHLSFFDENPDLMRVFHQVRGLLKFDHGEHRALRGVLVSHLRGLAHVLSLVPARGRASTATDLQVVTFLFGAVSGVASLRATVDGDLPRRMGNPELARALAAFAHELAVPARGSTTPAPERRARAPRRRAASARARSRATRPPRPS